jgi:hypothetical protein
VRAIRLAEDLLREVGQTKGIGQLLNALQLLATLAVLTNRTPVVPAVPCDSLWLRRHPMTPNGIADDYVLQLPPTSRPGATRCHAAIGGARCSHPLVLPAWHNIGGVDRLLERRPADRLQLRSSSSSSSAAAAADLRERAAHQQASPVLEVQSSDVFAHGGADAEARRAERRFRCGLPTTMVSEDSLSADERRRLDQLRAACPAFFAKRGTRRPQLDWLHRRRTIRSPEPRCTNVSGV